jgi:hypothetical protein
MWFFLMLILTPGDVSCCAWFLSCLALFVLSRMQRNEEDQESLAGEVK